jgi:hypothetical protein
MDINKHWDDQTWLRTLNKLTDLGQSQQPTGYQQMGIFFYAIGRFQPWGKTGQQPLVSTAPHSLRQAH